MFMSKYQWEYMYQLNDILRECNVYLVCMYQLLESNNQLCSINCSLEILENIFGFDLIRVYLVLSLIIYVTGDCRFQMHEVGYGITDLTACQNVLIMHREILFSPLFNLLLCHYNVIARICSQCFISMR